MLTILGCWPRVWWLCERTCTRHEDAYAPSAPAKKRRGSTGHRTTTCTTSCADTRPTPISPRTECNAQGGECITDGLGNYGNDERCTFTVLSSAVIVATEFATEDCEAAARPLQPCMHAAATLTSIRRGAMHGTLTARIPDCSSTRAFANRMLARRSIPHATCSARTRPHSSSS